MKASTVMRWVGPAAIAGGVLMVFSDLLNLTIYVPGLGEASHTGYQAVGSGVILIALTLLLVGMIGLYARQSPPTRTGVLRHDGLDFLEDDAEERLTAELDDVDATNAPGGSAPVSTPR
jgi:hypothetical protein